MGIIFSILTMRSVIIFAATTFSILIVMLSLNIITVDEVVVILKMSPEAADAFRVVISRTQEVTGNILDVASQLLNKIFGWAGVEVDLNKIKVDVNGNGGSAPPVSAPPATDPAQYPTGQDVGYGKYKSF
jgi:hypothetical protein